MNQRLSYWPFGKLLDFIGYKAPLAGLPYPFEVYSATVRLLCASCGALGRGEDKQVVVEGPTLSCGNCKNRDRSGHNAALNLARRAKELYEKGVVAR